MTTDIEAIRGQVYHYLSPAAAAAAGMTLYQMQQFIARKYEPSPEQLESLARYMKRRQT